MWARGVLVCALACAGAGITSLGVNGLVERRDTVRPVTDDGLVPPAPTGLETTVVADGVYVRWQQAAAPDIASYLLYAGGRTAVYDGPGTSAGIAGLTGGRGVTLTVHAVDVAGHVGPAAALTLVGSRVSTTVTPRRVVGGQRLVVTGRLAAGRAPLARRSVELYVRRSGTERWGLVTRRRTDARGTVQMPHSPPWSAEYRFEFGGAAGLLASTSPAQRVTVEPAVTIAASIRRVLLGDAVRFTGRVAPGDHGRRVQLQRHTLDGWRTVSIGALGEGGRYLFRLRLLTPRTHTYRIVASRFGRTPTQASGLVNVFVDGSVARTASRFARRHASTKAPLRLLATGDSLSYWLGKHTALSLGTRGAVVRDVQTSTGLTRPDIFDWYAHARQQVAKHDPEAVVVFLGGNDCQGVVVNGRLLRAASLGWTREYARRVQALLSIYSEGGQRRIYWVGMPPARAPDINACFHAQQNAARVAVLATPGAVWIDTWPLYTLGGKYAPTIRGVRVRQDDGIHLTGDGTRPLSARLLALLRQDWF